jgi:Photosynthetic reaction centre cytochrome C subunit
MLKRYAALTYSLWFILLRAAAAKQSPPPQQSPASEAGVDTSRPAAGKPQFAPLMAEDVYKNIEIMKGKPATSVLPMMLALRGLLGVDCEHCHVVGSWDKEDIPAKKTARMMFHMLEFIDTSMFDGKGRVNCWTCHRSQPKPPPFPMPATMPAERVAAERLIPLTPEQAAKPAEEVFHNIKAMRGVPAGQFPMIMAYFSRSLGVRCTFCHNLDDFPSDEKPPKQMARKMLGMVHDISQKFYNGGDTPIQCWNCHAGNHKPREGVGE